MLIRLHKKATTTPAIREYIRTCGKPIKALARELNLNVATVRKWRERGGATVRYGRAWKWALTGRASWTLDKLGGKVA